MSGILEPNGDALCQPADTLCGRPAPVHRGAEPSGGHETLPERGRVEGPPVTSAKDHQAIAIARSNARYPPLLGQQRGSRATVIRHDHDLKISRRRSWVSLNREVEEPHVGRAGPRESQEEPPALPRRPEPTPPAQGSCGQGSPDQMAQGREARALSRPQGSTIGA